MKKRGWTDGRVEVAYFLVAMLRTTCPTLLAILGWEMGHWFHSGYLHIDDIEVRVRDEGGGFVRRYDHAGWGKLAARDGSDGEDREWTCAAVFDDYARRLTVTLQHVDARPRTGGEPVGNPAEGHFKHLGEKRAENGHDSRRHK